MCKWHPIAMPIHSRGFPHGHTFATNLRNLERACATLLANQGRPCIISSSRKRSLPRLPCLPQVEPSRKEKYDHQVALSRLTRSSRI
eukprot:scaffold56250_cov34-Tisochrysis_lutea.AAC.2